MNIQNNGYLSIAQLTDQHLNKSQRTQATEGAESLSFQEILRQKALPGTGNLKFSKHAMGRLADRNIELSDSQLERLQSAAQKAGQKGFAGDHGSAGIHRERAQSDCRHGHGQHGDNGQYIHKYQRSGHYITGPCKEVIASGMTDRGIRRFDRRNNHYDEITFFWSVGS